MTTPIIGFAGMTHLGLVSGVVAAEKGFNVVGFDIQADRVDAITRGLLPVSEPQLDELVTKNKSRLQFTSDPKSLEQCDVIYVAQDVPTDDQGQSDVRPIDTMIETVMANARANATIVVLSQVPPGYTRQRQQASRVLYYQVETLVFGCAVARAMYPERYIVGSVDPSNPLPSSYRTFLDAYGCPILVMRYESAELAKISINMCLVASISTANTLAEVCENIGADWSEIVPALKLDKRIGQHAYLAPGLGISGGNLERDLATICSLKKDFAFDTGVVESWIANSRYRKNWAARTLRTALLANNPRARVAVWGLAYKENTHSVKNSPSVATIEQFPNTKFNCYDPVVSSFPEQQANVSVANSAMEALRGADVLMILTAWPEFRTIEPEEIAAALSGNIVIDPFGLLDAKKANNAGLNVYSLGREPSIAPVGEALCYDT